MTVKTGIGASVSNVSVLRVFTAFIDIFALAPVVVLYFAGKGLSFEDFLLVQVFYSLCLFAFEIPTGYLSDRLTRKTALFMGAVLAGIGNLAIIPSDGFYQILAAEAVVAFGLSFVSGSTSAILFEHLKSSGEVERYREQEGRMRAWGAYAFGFSALIGGLLFIVDPDLPLVVTGMTCFAAAGAALLLREVEAEPGTTDGSVSRKLGTLFVNSLRTGDEFPWVLGFYGLLAAGTTIGTYLAQPRLEELGVPVYLLGGMLAAQLVVQGIFLTHSGKLTSGISPLRLCVLLSVVLSLILFFQAWFPAIGSFAVSTLHGAVAGVAAVLMNETVNNRVESSFRATALSTGNMLKRIVMFIAAPSIGAVASASGSSSALMFASCGVIAFTALLAFLSIGFRRRAHVSSGTPRVDGVCNESLENGIESPDYRGKSS